MLLFFEPSLVQKKVLEGLEGVGDAFNENKTFKLNNSEIVKQKKENKKPEFTRNFLSNKVFELFNSVFLFSLFIEKFSNYEKLAVTSQFDLTRFYGVTIRNSVF